MVVHKPQLDYTNGTSVLLPEIEDIISNGKLSRKERAMFTSIAYILKRLPTLCQDVDTLKETLKVANLSAMNQDIEVLKSNDWFGFLKKYPKFFILLACILYLFLISPVRDAVLKFLGEILQILIKLA